MRLALKLQRSLGPCFLPVLGLQACTPYPASHSTFLITFERCRFRYWPCGSFYLFYLHTNSYSSNFITFMHLVHFLIVFPMDFLGIILKRVTFQEVFTKHPWWCANISSVLLLFVLPMWVCGYTCSSTCENTSMHASVSQRSVCINLFLLPLFFLFFFF